VGEGLRKILGEEKFIRRKGLSFPDRLNLLEKLGELPWGTF